MDLRRDAISYSKYIAKQKCDNFKNMLSEQKRLEDIIAVNPTDEVLEQAEAIKDDIEEYNSEKARGAQLRSKADWVEYGEKNNKYFLTLENKNRQIKNITMLLDDEEKEIIG
jgi:hypothetical protein